MLRIKRDDDVIVIAGKDKGKRGKILSIAKDGRYFVAGINLVKKHQKPNPQMNVPGGIVEQEAAIQSSNIAIFNPQTEKADRVGFRVEGDKKVRFFKSNDALIDA